MLSSIVEGSADLIWTSFGMIGARYPYVDFLPPFSKAFGGIFIPNQSIMEKYDYDVYLDPFDKYLWYSLLAISLIMSLFTFIIHNLHKLNWVRTFESKKRKISVTRLR